MTKTAKITLVVIAMLAMCFSVMAQDEMESAVGVGAGVGVDF